MEAREYFDDIEEFEARDFDDAEDLEARGLLSAVGKVAAKGAAKVIKKEAPKVAKKAAPKIAKAIPKVKKAVPKVAKAIPKAKKAAPKVAKAISKVKKAAPKVAKAVPTKRTGKSSPAKTTKVSHPAGKPKQAKARAAPAAAAATALPANKLTALNGAVTGAVTGKNTTVNKGKGISSKKLPNSVKNKIRNPILKSKQPTDKGSELQRKTGGGRLSSPLRNQPKTSGHRTYEEKPAPSASKWQNFENGETQDSRPQSGHVAMKIGHTVEKVAKAAQRTIQQSETQSHVQTSQLSTQPEMAALTQQESAEQVQTANLEQQIASRH